MDVLLIDLDQNNWQQATNLQVKPGQEPFAPSNLFHIAQARFFPDWVLLGIFVHNEMVGFAIYGPGGEGEAYLSHLMIDARYQGKGYGTAALRQILQRIKEQYASKGVWLSYHPQNTVAEKLYRKFGFNLRSTGLESEVEVFMYLPLLDSGTKA